MFKWLQKNWVVILIAGFFLCVLGPFFCVGLIQAERKNRETCEKWKKSITQKTFEEAAPEIIGDNWYRFDARPVIKQNWDIHCQTEVQVWPEIYKRFQRKHPNHETVLRNTMFNSRNETVFVQVEIIPR